MNSTLVRVTTRNSYVTVTMLCKNTGDDLKRRLLEKFNDMVAYTILSTTKVE